jgi:hypothetical protein
MMNDPLGKLMEEIDPARDVSDETLLERFPNVQFDPSPRASHSGRRYVARSILHSRRAVTVLLVAALAGAFASGAELASASPNAPHLQKQTTCDYANGAPNFRTVSAAGQLDSSLESTYPNVYGGLSLGNCNATIILYVTVVSPQLAASASAVAPPGSLQYVVVANTLKQLMSVQQALGLKGQSLIDEGIKILGYGTDIPANVETIQVENATSSQIATLQRDFGANLISVQPGTPGGYGEL